MDTGTSQLIEFTLNNGYIWISVGIIIGLSVKWLFQTEIVKGWFKRKQDKQTTKQIHQYTLQDNMQLKFFTLTQGIVAQNNTLQQFIKQSVMKQFQNIRSRDDWTQRYIDQIGERIKQVSQMLHQVLQRMGKPFLSKDVAKWLFQIVMQLHIRKILDYLIVVKQRYTQSCNKEILSQDLYRTFRQITRQQMQFMNNFKTHYGEYGKVLKDVLQPQNFWKFIKEVLPTLQKQKQEMIKQAQLVMLNYKDQLIKFIQDK